MATHTTLQHNGVGSDSGAQSPPPSPQSSTASPSPPTSTPLKTSPHQPQSFCIDALLRPNEATSPLSPPTGSSPPSSPTSSPYGPRLLPPSLFPTNPATGASLYPYPGALLNTTGSVAGAGGTPPTSVPSSLESVLKNGMNMQTVQLEWLARTGMLYHRFPELAGNLYFHLSPSPSSLSISFCLLSTCHALFRLFCQNLA